MQTIVVERTLRAPADKVFELLTDHANYRQFPGVTGSSLLQEGTPERNGVGALRRIETPKGWFEETITAFERPRRFEYRIVRSSLPLEHQGGTVVCEPTADGTRVTWTTVMRVKIPLIGGWLTKLAAGALSQAFGAMLKDADRRLAA